MERVFGNEGHNSGNIAKDTKLQVWKNTSDKIGSKIKCNGFMQCKAQFMQKQIGTVKFQF